MPKQNKYIKPVPEKYQRRARLRRLKQMVSRCEVTEAEAKEIREEIERDYASWRSG